MSYLMKDEEINKTLDKIEVLVINNNQDFYIFLDYHNDNLGKIFNEFNCSKEAVKFFISKGLLESLDIKL